MNKPYVNSKKDSTRKLYLKYRFRVYYEDLNL